MAQQFSVDQKSLMTILSSMQPICGKRTPREITGSILFAAGHRELVLKSTDLEISLQASCGITKSSHTTPELFLVSGKRIGDVVKELEGEITCSLKQGQLVLEAGPVKLQLNIQDAQEFPPFPERIENLMSLDTATVAAMLERVAFLLPQNQSNVALTGLLLEVTPEGLTMTTTDGHCLAQVRTASYTLSDAKRWLIPRRAIFELKKLIESTEEATIFLGVCGNQLVFSGESFNFFTKLLADQFPLYAPILDKQGFVRATAERSAFLKAVRRCATLLSGQFLATRFSCTQNRINVSMQNNDVGTLDEQLVLREGIGDQEIDIRLYAPYLLSGLQVLPEDTLTFFLKSEARPIIFESIDQSIGATGVAMTTTYVVMPVSPRVAG